MFTRIAFASLIVTGSATLALAQSNSLPAAPPTNSVPTSGVTSPPSQTAPSPPSAAGPGQTVVPQAAREGEKGLPTGENANSGGPVIVKRKP
jgi:hypothetical protein